MAEQKQQSGKESAPQQQQSGVGSEAGSDADMNKPYGGEDFAGQDVKEDRDAMTHESGPA